MQHGPDSYLPQLKCVHSKQRFDGEFAVNAQEKSVAHTLLSFINVLVRDLSFRHDLNSEVDGRKSVVLYIAELLIYNAV